jgi:hypothetical protein
MKERSVHRDMALPAYYKTAKISTPRQRAFDLPPAFIAPQLPSILQRPPRTIFSVRPDHINTLPSQALTQCIRIAGFVVDQPLGTLSQTAPTLSGHGNRLQGRLHPLPFRWGRRCQEVSQRNTLAVNLHHPRRTFAPLGFAHAGPPFWGRGKAAIGKGLRSSELAKESAPSLQPDVLFFPISQASPPGTGRRIL